jgi:DNA-binding winged helix-turn-helix (wHTH) protein/tetratricopeptide (TPR) repeat protein
VIFRFKDFRLDTDLRELRSGAETQVLEPQVFDLLVYLVKNRKRVVAKDELVQSVWGGRIVSDATINSRINAARRALHDKGTQQSIIRTFPKRGVRFVADAVEEPEPQVRTDLQGAPVDVGRSPDTKPRLMVLPFACIGDAPETLSLGLADAIRVGLSRRTGIEIVSQEVAARLGSEPNGLASHHIDYLLRGDIQRSGTRLRISTELIETQNARQIWAERYDRDMQDIIVMEDEVAHLILMTVRWKLHAWDGQRIAEKTSSKLSTGDRLAQAARHFYTATPESYEQAAVILDAVLQNEPQHPMALGMRAFALFAAANFGTEPLPVNERKRAISLAELALEHQQGSDFLHWVRGTLALYLECDQEFALRQANRALDLNRHFAPALRLTGESLSYAGQIAQGISILEELLVADQRAPANAIVLWVLALAYFATDDLQAALDRIDAALMRIVTMPDFYLTRAAVLAELNRIEEAQSVLAKLRTHHAGLSTSKIRIPPYKQAHNRERYVSALLRAGLS